LLATSLLLLDWQGLAFLSSERATFVVAALALAAIWMLAAALSLLSVSGWTGLSLTIGLSVLVAMDRSLRPVTVAHTTLAAVGGLATALALMVFALERSLRARPTTLASGGSRLPSRGYLLLEGLPYFVYGTFGVFIFFSVHVIGWAHLSPGSADLTTLELGLFLPLAPTVLGSGRAERSLRLFWVRASLLQTTIPAETPQRFGAELGTLYRQERRRYLRSITAMSLWTLVIGESLILSGKLRELTHYSDTRELQALFLASLLAYALLGSAQFSAMFGLSWSRCSGPLQAVLTGAVVTMVLGWWFASELGYAWLGAALLIGGACYALVSSLTVRRLFISADYYYVMAL